MTETASCFLHGDFDPALRRCPECHPRRVTRGDRAWFALRTTWAWATLEGHTDEMPPELVAEIREVLGDDPFDTTAIEIASGDAGG